MTKPSPQQYDTLIIGAGAAGLHCAANAARRGKRVLVIDHAKQAGKRFLSQVEGAVTLPTSMPAQRTICRVTPIFVNRHLAVTPSGIL